MANTVIETEGLSKRYGSHLALDNVSLSVQRGAIGLLGPNGAGKTTLMKCLLQLQPFSEGSARLLGIDVKRGGREIRKRIGYAPERDCLIPGMVGSEYVTYCAQLSGLPFFAARQRTHEILDYVGLGQERYRAVDTYSTGMKQKLKIAQAIVHDPELIFLDEPTNGLDPEGRVQTLKLIHSLWQDHGISFILSSHLLHDIDQICEDIIIVGKGKVLVHDNLERLKQNRQGAAEITISGDTHGLVTLFERVNWSCSIQANGALRVEHGFEDLSELLKILDDANIVPIDIVRSPNALEEAFLQAVGDEHGAG